MPEHYDRVSSLLWLPFYTGYLSCMLIRSLSAEGGDVFLLDQPNNFFAHGLEENYFQKLAHRFVLESRIDFV